VQVRFEGLLPLAVPFSATPLRTESKSGRQFDQAATLKGVEGYPDMRGLLTNHLVAATPT